MNVATSNSPIAKRLLLARRTATLTLSACAAVVLCATANAATAIKPTTAAPSLVVKFRDLDVRTDHGAEVLYQRIKTAARRVCPDVTSGSLAERTAGWSCRRTAINRAVESVNSPQVATLLKDPRLASTR